MCASSPSGETMKRLLLLAAFLPLSAHAQVDELQFHGFAGQTVISTTGNHFFGQTRDTLGFDYREAGLNASFKATPNLLLSAQVLSRQAGAADDGSLRLDYAFMRYELQSDEQGTLALQLGKQKSPYGLYNETRDTPGARPGILLPESIYVDNLRNNFQSAPGIQILKDYRNEEHQFSFGLGIARVGEIEKSGKLSLFASDTPGNYQQGRVMHGQMKYEHEGGRLRAALSHMESDFAYRPGNGDIVSAHRFRYIANVASLQLNGERWSITGEYALIREAMSEGGPWNFDVTGIGYYIQGEWRFTSAWSGFARYDDFCVDRTDKQGLRYAAVTGRQAEWIFARDFTIGGRYRFAPGWALSGEWHKVTGSGWLPHVDNMNGAFASQTLARDWDIFLVQLSYQF